MRKVASLAALFVLMIGLTACEADNSQEALYDAACTTCGSDIEDDAACTTCGSDIDYDSACTTCGSDIDTDAACTTCGSDIDDN